MKILMKILKQIKQIAGVVAGWFACSEGRASSTPELPLKAVKPDLSVLTENEVMAKMLTALVDLGALTRDEADMANFTGELPTGIDVIKRITDKYNG